MRRFFLHSWFSFIYPNAPFWVRYKKGFYSFPCLNTAQFLGALNDNIYKPLIMFFLINAMGTEHSSSILSAVGALYITPFLLFSSIGGILADRYSKAFLVQILKGCEIFIMSFAIWAFYAQSFWGCYLLLFCLATHSALFGPSKYGILPEIIQSPLLPQANGHITSATYLAIILGTFLASFFAGIGTNSFLIGASFCLLFSIIGFGASLGIKTKTSLFSSKKISMFFIRDILNTLNKTHSYPFVFPSIVGSSFFLLLGGFVQLNIIPLTIQSLHLSPHAGGYLFFLTAIGIAFGSFLSGKIQKKKIHLGLSCLMGYNISLCLLLMSYFSWNVYIVSGILIMLGVCGGMFILPFDTCIQANSPNNTRGQTIATSNFLSFLGVLIASFYLYIAGSILSLSAASSFFVIGLVTWFVSLFLSLQLLEMFAPFLARHIPIYRNIPIIDVNTILPYKKIYLVEDTRLSTIWKLYQLSPSMHFLIPKHASFNWIKIWIPSLHFRDPSTPFAQLIEEAKSLQIGERRICLLLNSPIPEQNNAPSMMSLFSFQDTSICSIRSQKQSHRRHALIVEQF